MTDVPAPSLGAPAGPGVPSLVELVAGGMLDAELAALVWVLVEADVPLVVGAPGDRLAAGAQLLRGILGSIRPDPREAPGLDLPLDRMAAWQLVRGGRPGGLLAATSLDELRRGLAGPPVRLSSQELTFLGCVLVLGPADDQPTGRLRVVAAHYLRPLARDAHGHAQELPPAVLATWDPRLQRYEHFAWGVIPEIALRLERKAGDLEMDLHHRRDDLAGLVTARVTGLEEVRRLIAGYRVGYGHPHDARQN
jgi:hypothetical protein